MQEVLAGTYTLSYTHYPMAQRIPWSKFSLIRLGHNLDQMVIHMPLFRRRLLSNQNVPDMERKHGSKKNMPEV